MYKTVGTPALPKSQFIWRPTSAVHGKVISESQSSLSPREMKKSGFTPQKTRELLS